MAGEWVTFCCNCPMYQCATEESEDGWCVAGPEPIEKNLALGWDPSLGCAEPLRMAIAAGFVSVEEFTEARMRERKTLTECMNENLARLADTR